MFANFWSSQLTNFSTDVWDIWGEEEDEEVSQDEVSQLPFLKFNEGLYLLNRVVPYLKSIILSVHTCKNTGIFRLGTIDVRIEGFDLLDCLNIITRKCVNLENVDVRLVASFCQFTCDKGRYPDYSYEEDILEYKKRFQESQFTFLSLLKSNPKLKTLTIRDHETIIDNACLFPQVPMMSNLEELTISANCYDDVKNFSFLSEKLTLLDLGNVSLDHKDLRKALKEILRHQKTLQILKLDIVIDRHRSSVLSKLAALRKCSSLVILEIKIAARCPNRDYRPTEGDLFVAKIIKGCTNLEYVLFSSVSLNNETIEQIFSLPNLKHLVFSEHEIFTTYKMMNDFQF